MAEAEKQARRRRCTHVWLDAFAFQAPRFYGKLGYKKFGELKNYRMGYKRFFYKKRPYSLK